MFIKRITKKYIRKGKVKIYIYYRLCESYRIGSSVRHRTILNLGDLKELKSEEEYKLLADRIEEKVRGEGRLFLETNEVVERLAEKFSKIIIEKRLLDITKEKEEGKKEEREGGEPLYEEVDVNSIGHEKVREVGAEWMCKQVVDILGIGEYLKGKGWKEKWVTRGILYIISKAVYSASDRKTVEWLKDNSGLCDLLGIRTDKLNRHQLYKVSEMLYKEKEGIEMYLRKRTGELFQLEGKIIIYDFTNIYFEGKKGTSEKARYGRSKERRDDAKLMALGLVVGMEGFIKHSRICEGNISESKVFRKEIEELEKYREGEKKVVVIDAGLASEENLKVLREKGYEYVCIGKGRQEYEEIEGGEGITIKDKKGNDIYIKWIRQEDGGENFLYVKSKKKEKKEEAMEEVHAKRYEEGLQNIREGIKRKGGVKRVEKVYERIGRLKEKYPRVNKLYKVEVIKEGEIAKDIKWEREKGKKEHGVYFIRTTFKEKDEESLWRIYNTIREVEATFRVLKNDIKIRPVFHIKDRFSEAHIYGGIIAYQIVNTIRHQLKKRGINYDWQNIVRIMNSQKIVISTIKAKTGSTIYIKKCSKAEKGAKEIYQTLKLKEMPFWQKKSVFPEKENVKAVKVDSS